MNDAYEFRMASRGDEPALRDLLAAASLPVDDLSIDAQEYLLARSGAELVGCVGLEACGDAGLFRSFAVAIAGARVSARRCSTGSSRAPSCAG